MDGKQNNFSFKDCFGLINQIHPKYWQLVVVIILGFISTGASLFVPQLAQIILNTSAPIWWPLLPSYLSVA